MYHFTQPENAVMFDKSLPPTAKVVYCALLKYADKQTKKCTVYIRTLAEIVGRSIRTIQRSLSMLISKGLIARDERVDKYGINHASEFTILETERIDEDGTTPRQEGQTINNTLYNNNINLKGEALPQSEEKCEDGVKSVPDIMRTTAQYWLQRTGRKALNESEIMNIRDLATKHTPVRVQKEIDRVCEIFTEKGRALVQMSFNYIHACLKNQVSFLKKKKTAYVSLSAHKRRQLELNALVEVC